MIYNPTYFNGKHLIDGRLGLTSVNHFIMKDGIIVGMFQGSRGDRPDLDFIIKHLEPGVKSRIRTPSHTHWIVDLIIKHNINSEVTKKFIRFYRKKYDELLPFKTIKGRNNYKLVTPAKAKKNYGDIEHKGSYSLEYLATIIELFIKCEKRTAGAFMFKGLLEMMVAYTDNKKDYYQIISYSKRV